MDKFKIRTANIEDADIIHDIHTKAARITCAESYSKAQIDVWLKKRKPAGYYDGINKKEMFVAELDGQVVGFGHANPGVILAIFVHPDCQQLGIGKGLLNYALPIALNNSPGLILEATPNAVAFYKKCGFVKISDGTITRNGIELEVVNMRYGGKVLPE